MRLLPHAKPVYFKGKGVKSGEGYMKIKDLPKIDRPREKLAKYGPERLSNSELLAILLRTGGKNINVVSRQYCWDNHRRIDY